MRALIERAAEAQTPYRIAAVISDQAAAPGLATAREFGVPSRAVPVATGMNRLEYDRSLAAVVDEYAPSLIALAGFMRILSGEFVERHLGRLLNIHPSLLPRFPGLHTHRRALEAHALEHGATVHFVTEQLDGGPAVLQARVAVRASDDESSLAARVLEREHRIYPLAVRWYCEGRLAFADGRAWLDGNALAQPVQYDDIEFSGAT
jgi:phosphoribosylglycinamide formyltransferase-1